MVAQQASHLDIERSRIGRLALEEFEVPYVHLADAPVVQSRLRVDGTEYTYDRSYPVKGHSAVMPGAIRGLLAEGRRVLVAERGERHFVYLA
ncbi:MAG: hypothetical protein A2148_03405 [Chloroflexi bacterium RBG_16_68_14]|nr:MAG: hypothetical protein A2148_03405 [Chloroflexi bacterium RBG_16_68_14]